MATLAKNIFGEPLEICSTSPLTGFYRTGCCESGEEDEGSHTVCTVLSREFLLFSKAQGNDLMTPIPQLGFPGLQEGDRWCICLSRWLEAQKQGMAPKVILEATNEKILEHISLEAIIPYAHK